MIHENAAATAEESVFILFVYIHIKVVVAEGNGKMGR
jgi:hypothetical protein